MASVTFDKATRLYPGSTKPAVDAIDLSVADGEFLVLGPAAFRRDHVAEDGAPGGRPGRREGAERRPSER